VDDKLDELEGLEGRIAEIAVEIGVASVGVGVGVAAFCADFFGYVLAAVVFID
jgi:hypothetical protein